MKKIIFTIFILSLYLGYPNKAYANSEGKFVINGSTDENYVFDTFTVWNTITDLSDTAYVDFKLKDYLINGMPKYNDYNTYGVLEWETPDYIIIEGTQIVKLNYHDSLQDKNVVFDIKIFGIPNNKKLDNSSKNLDIINRNELRYYFIDITYTGRVGGDILNIFPKMSFYNVENKEVLGDLSFPDWDNTKEGEYIFTWIFTPYDTTYNSVSDTIKIKLSPKLVEEIEDITAPSLTATTILLDTRTAYDINLNDKVSGSTYLWSTDDTEIIELNSKNGKIKAKKEGNAKVTCETTLPDGNKNILKSSVTVGYDENAPLLTETILDLEVGDKFDINLENKISKSSYRWTSSNRDIVKVNSSNGKVTAINVGEAYVTCTITIPKTNQVIVLRCDINVTK